MGLPQLRPEEIASHDPNSSTTSPAVRVAIDVAKLTHQVLLELPSGQATGAARGEYEVGDRALRGGASGDRSPPCEIAFEPTGDYHRPLAYILGQAGFHLWLVSSLAVARTREAMYNSWDKNDPKDAQVILHLLKTGRRSDTWTRSSRGITICRRWRTRISKCRCGRCDCSTASSRTICRCIFPRRSATCTARGPSGLPSSCSSRLAPRPCANTRRRPLWRPRASRSPGARSTRRAGSPTSTTTACHSVGVPVAPDSETMRMFRVVLEEYRALCRLRKRLEADIVTRLATHPDFVRLQTLPGIGPILAMIILAEASDLRRFGCARQFLKYCGFDLCTEQSGQFRGTTHLSKRGNARLRYAFWMAGTVAIRMRQNSFRRKFEDYIRPDPQNRGSATERRTPRWRPKWPASRTPWSQPASTIVASPKRRDQAGGSLRQGPSRRMRPRR